MPYQPKSFAGGYTDFETQPGIHYVSFRGNGNTSKDTVIQYWHQRAAEICGGRDRYEIVSQGASTRKYSVNPSQEASSGTSCHHCTGSDRAKCFGRLMPALPLSGG